MSALNRPDVRAFIGATGSGKGVSIGRVLDDERPARLLVWDPRDEYGKRAQRFDHMGSFVQAVGTAQRGSFRYVPGPATDIRKAFAVWCRVAFTWGDCWAVVDELGDVTMPGWAPPAWKTCITQGRHRGLHVLGAAQRPALIDKTFLGNATYVRCFTLADDGDVHTMARALRVPVLEVAGLATTEAGTVTRITYLERDRRAGLLQKGEIKLTRRPKKQAPT